MSRRSAPERRSPAPDMKFNSVKVTMFVNRLMYGGKKSTARSVFYDAMAIIERREKLDPIELFESALKNAAPRVEVKPRRVGGSTYQVPLEVTPYRQTTLSMRWLIGAARKRSGRSMAEKLANEVIDASKNQGAAVKKKDDTHRMAEANRAFAHFRF